MITELCLDRWCIGKQRPLRHQRFNKIGVEVLLFIYNAF